MKDKLRHAFDTLKMPDACANQIKEELCKPQREKCYYADPAQPGRGGWVKGIAAVAALLAVMLAAGRFLSGPEKPRLSDAESITESTEGTHDSEEIREDLNALKKELEELQDRLGSKDAEYRFDQYYVIGEDGKVYVRHEYVAQANAKSAPDWLMDEGGRLYFVGNGEKIDITDEISLEEPYIYTYTDGENTKLALIVGRTSAGPYVDIGNSVGWMCYYWHDTVDNWVGGGGTHWSNWLDAEWPWLTMAKQELDIPWS